MVNIEGIHTIHRGVCLPTGQCARRFLVKFHQIYSCKPLRQFSSPNRSTTAVEKAFLLSSPSSHIPATFQILSLTPSALLQFPRDNVPCSGCQTPSSALQKFSTQEEVAQTALLGAAVSALPGAECTAQHHTYK